MESESKVFSSNIIRSNNRSQNNLYDLLNIVPVQPLPENIDENTTIDHPCDFVPKSDKFYVPKKKNGRKVHTVRDIRNIFEKDVYSYLPTELEKQRNILLRKIQHGSLKNAKTKELAINMLKSDTPMSKSAWQMLLNINPEEHKFCPQYILWKGKNIQINGSRGGQHKFICNYDIGKFKQSSQIKSVSKSTILTRRRQLLQHSLNVKFKPGPLSKKKYLDDSYQKYQFGEIELVSLPKAGLEVQTSYGKPLAPVIDTFINKSFLKNDGLITEKWANFAVSVVGKNENGYASQIEITEDSCVTFDLNYKCFQNKILMRHDSDIENKPINNKATRTSAPQEDLIIISEVRNFMDNLLNAVEISLKQDEIYTGEDEPREVITCNTLNTTTHSNSKTKRKGELHRLDVTVITISETIQHDKTIVCQKDYCTLGCICDSLKCSYNLKRHCGRMECMFNCKCDFTKYKYMNSFDNDDCCDIIPGLINLDQTLGQTLAKEEHKFHQTVIVTDDKSILLKSDRRNWKASKKYADFYSNMRLKTKDNTSQMLSIVCPNLSCKNVEPWCMVHNLYKCFCKGKFTETGRRDLDEIKTIENDNANSKLNTTTSDTLNITEKGNETIDNIELIDDVTNTSLRLRQDSQSDKYSKKCYGPQKIISCNSICARVQPYVGRKYNDEYYKNTNTKIVEMEKNDKSLRKRIISLINSDEDKNNPIINVEQYMPSTLELLSNVIDNTFNDSNAKENTRRLPVKTRLVSWLEKSYKQYKQRADRGLLKVSLEPPDTGKLCLYSWDFILSRYQERKNYFFISKQKPFRIFMAVDLKNTFFENCINVRDIVPSEIDNYPVTIKNLLTNAIDLQETFCILCGLSQCWELIGSVTKVNENRNIPQKETESNELSIPEKKLSESNTSSDNHSIQDIPINNNACELEMEDCSSKSLQVQDCNDVPDQKVASSEIPISKWFVMKIENDFSEIQFINKGFFVKYESVLKAINVARVSEKTVRLSSQKCSNSENYPQFGIYAIPRKEESCVFIGPYEKDETLGIDAVKKIKNIKSIIHQFCTRGIWITTNKADNMKVIDNPLEFIPPTCWNNDRMVELNNESTDTEYNNFSNEIAPNVQTKIPETKNTKPTIKQVKPIKIRKTNGFYHLTPNGCLKPIQSPEKDFNSNTLLTNTQVANTKGPLFTFTSSKIKPNFTSKRSSKDGKALLGTKPIAEIAPQIKGRNGDINIPKEQNRKLQRGMFVLKPEEINKRSIENIYIQPQTSQQSIVSFDIKDEISMDIENFLATSVVCTSPRDEVYVISDDENETRNTHCSKEESCKNVWIACKNIESLGWIAGKKNVKNYISFDFPGFISSTFYPEHEALKKICQIFARKVYVPKHIELQWQVFESAAEVESIKKLEAEYLLPDYILTTKGLQHKYDAMTSLESSSFEESTQPSELIDDNESLNEESLKQKSKIMTNLEETSKTLEDESNFLWHETMSRRSAILETFSEAPEELRSELADQLNCIITHTKD